MPEIKQDIRTATFIVAANDSLHKNMADYVCDGVNDHLEIQAAIDALPTDGGKVVLLEGTYVLAIAITLPNNTELVGTGHTLIEGPADANGYRLITNSDIVGGNTNIKISNIEVDGKWIAGGIDQLGGLISFCKVNGGLIEDVTIKNGYRHNLEIGRSQNVYVTRVRCETTKGDDNFSVSDGGCYGGNPGAGLRESRNLVFRDCISLNTTGSDYEVDDGPREVYFVNCLADSSHDAFVVHVHAGGEYAPQGIYFINCRTLGNNNVGFVATSDQATIDSMKTSKILIANCSMPGTVDPSRRAVLLRGVDDVKVINNSFLGGGIEVYPGTVSGYRPDNIEIIGNTINMNESWLANVAGVEVHDIESYCLIADNHEKDTSYGIWVHANADDCKGVIVRNNTCYTNSSYGCYIKAEAGKKIIDLLIQGNIFTDLPGVTRQDSGIRFDGPVANFLKVRVKDNVLDPYANAPIQFENGANVYCALFKDNVGFIGPNEIRTASGSLTAGNANAIGFAWHDPELQDVLIKKVVIEVTTVGGTVGSHLDVGIADDAAGTNRGTEFFDDLLLNSVQINDSWVAGDGGAQTKYVFCQDSASATDGWIVGQILDANAAALVGTYYIEYVGR